MKANRPLILAVFAVFASFVAFSVDEKPDRASDRGGRGGGRRSPDEAIDDPRFLFRTEVPAHPLDVVLGRPTKTLITASVLTDADREGVIAYGPRAGVPTAKTSMFVLKAGEPVQTALTGLQPDTEYFYTLSTREQGSAWKAEPEHRFRTQRPAGKAFTFTVQADPHLDYNTDPELYVRCLRNALADTPDFHIDLGDTFMTDKRPNFMLAAPQYVAQRYYFGLIGHSAPVFLVLGNHDGESRGKGRGGDSDAMAVWSNGMRKKYFANPVPDGFYTGNATPHPQAGLLEDYYAWEWGDALFVVLDPFWFTEKRGDDGWARTLGREQYDWLAATLVKSRAKFRFVFLHHLVGGFGKDARGGAEAAPLYEWGGHNESGVDEFAVKRQGWPMPIHDLLVKNHVNIVFHGHDHVYMKQDLDGIVYQEVPQPGHPRFDNTRSAEEYGYKTGTLLGSSGHLRVRVSADKSSVEYVRAVLSGSESVERRNGAVAHRYEVIPR